MKVLTTTAVLSLLVSSPVLAQNGLLNRVGVGGGANVNQSLSVPSSGNPVQSALNAGFQSLDRNFANQGNAAARIGLNAGANALGVNPQVNANANVNAYQGYRQGYPNSGFNNQQYRSQGNVVYGTPNYDQGASGPVITNSYPQSYFSQGSVMQTSSQSPVQAGATWSGNATAGYTTTQPFNSQPVMSHGSVQMGTISTTAGAQPGTYVLQTDAGGREYINVNGQRVYFDKTASTHQSTESENDVSSKESDQQYRSKKPAMKESNQDDRSQLRKINDDQSQQADEEDEQQTPAAAESNDQSDQ